MGLGNLKCSFDIKILSALNAQARKQLTQIKCFNSRRNIRDFTETKMRSATNLSTQLYDWVRDLSKMPSHHDHNSDEVYLQTITFQEKQCTENI